MYRIIKLSPVTVKGFQQVIAEDVTPDGETITDIKVVEQTIKQWKELSRKNSLNVDYICQIILV